MQAHVHSLAIIVVPQWASLYWTKQRSLAAAIRQARFPAAALTASAHAGVEPDQLQAARQPAQPRGLHQHGHCLPRWLPVRLWRQGGGPAAVPHQLQTLISGHNQVPGQNEEGPSGHQQGKAEVPGSSELHMAQLPSPDTSAVRVHESQGPGNACPQPDSCRLQWSVCRPESIRHLVYVQLLMACAAHCLEIPAPSMRTPPTQH